MRFDLTAYRAADGVSQLALEAGDAQAARRLAEAQGYRVLELAAATPGRGRGWAPGFSVPLFAQELLALLDAGLGLVEAVDLLAGKARQPEAQRILGELRRRMGEGLAFSRALEGCADAFPALFVATVRASERTGDLALALRRYLAYQRQLTALRDKLLAASVYPLLLGGVGVLVVVFLMVYVVPRFARIYEDVGRGHLPLLSRALMQWGQWVGEHVLLLSLALAGLAAMAAFLLTRPSVWGGLERRLWRLPLVGEQVRLYQLARFTRTVSMLLRGGVPLLAALGMVDELLRQPALRQGLRQARQAVGEGRAVSDVFAANGLATEIGTRLLVVGERSGELAEAMERIASFYDEEIGRAVEWFSRLFEPALMVVIGLLIGGIVILMYMPIFELASAIQ